jgi:hypothetical protein
MVSAAGGDARFERRPARSRKEGHMIKEFQEFISKGNVMDLPSA